MKYFDLSTVYTAILTCNILIAIIAVIIRNEKIMINVGYKLITIFLLLTAVRFLLPIEISSATTVPLPHGISGLIVKLFVPLFYINKFKVKPIHFVLLIWIAGIVIQGIRYYRANRKIYTYIFTYGKNVTNEKFYKNVMKQIHESSPDPFCIYEIPDLKSPILYGFRTPYILLPSYHVDPWSPLDEKAIVGLTYILKHEVAHYKHHDLWIKFLVRLLSIIYWWNPFCHLLNKQTDLVLEMRIDDTVTSLSDQEISAYLHTLLHMAEHQDEVLTQPLGNVISFAHNNSGVLTKRFQMLLNRKQKKNKGQNLLLILIVGIIYLSSYLFVLEAYYVPANDTSITFYMPDNSTYLIDNEDGTYTIYINNYKIETIDSLDYYDTDVPIYTREEYEHVQKSNQK